MTTDANVFGTLAHDSRVSLERATNLGNGVTAAIWRNEHDEARYIQPGHHTLSVYLQGGYTTYRRDPPHLFGAPDHVCILPAEHQSSWVIEQPMRFVHLYFTPDTLAGHAVRLLDAEPRLFTLHGHTLIEDVHLTQACANIAQLDWIDPDDRIHANALINDTLSYLVQTQSRTRVLAVHGGLTPHVCRRIATRIGAELHLPLSLRQLAAETNLSEFHFAQILRASSGATPHEWVMQQRMTRARTLLHTTALALATIAERCDFASPSHFSRRFVLQLGAPPSRCRLAW